MIFKSFDDVLSFINLDNKLKTNIYCNKVYNIKIIKCGDYIQLYNYSDKKIKNNIKDLDINKLSKNIYLETQQKNDKINKIENKNIIRTKLNCQRIAKSNSKDWKSFITLTYKKNMTDIKKAKLDLNYTLKNIKKIKKDLKYIVVIEFQKRGAIHFHLLSNLSIDNDSNIIIPQKQNNKYYSLKYWSKGFSMYEDINNDIKKVIGYISKYMTKDCDNRLFNYKRYSHSSNLKLPVEEYINFDSLSDYKYFKKIMKGKNCIYKNVYKDSYNNDIEFSEYL